MTFCSYSLFTGKLLVPLNTVDTAGDPHAYKTVELSFSTTTLISLEPYAELIELYFNAELIELYLTFRYTLLYLYRDSFTELEMTTGTRAISFDRKPNFN